jgi:hypothetical protein
MEPRADVPPPEEEAIETATSAGEIHAGKPFFGTLVRVDRKAGAEHEVRLDTIPEAEPMTLQEAFSKIENLGGNLRLYTLVDGDSREIEFSVGEAPSEEDEQAGARGEKLPREGTPARERLHERWKTEGRNEAKKQLREEHQQERKRLNNEIDRLQDELAAAKERNADLEQKRIDLQHELDDLHRKKRREIDEARAEEKKKHEDEIRKLEAKVDRLEEKLEERKETIWQQKFEHEKSTEQSSADKAIEAFAETLQPALSQLLPGAAGVKSSDSAPDGGESTSLPPARGDGRRSNPPERPSPSRNASPEASPEPETATAGAGGGAAEDPASPPSNDQGTDMNGPDGPTGRAGGEWANAPSPNGQSNGKADQTPETQGRAPHEPADGDDPAPNGPPDMAGEEVSQEQIQRARQEFAQLSPEEQKEATLQGIANRAMQAISDGRDAAIERFRQEVDMVATSMRQGGNPITEREWREVLSSIGQGAVDEGFGGEALDRATEPIAERLTTQDWVPVVQNLARHAAERNHSADVVADVVEPILRQQIGADSSVATTLDTLGASAATNMLLGFVEQEPAAATRAVIEDVLGEIQTRL